MRRADRLFQIVQYLRGGRLLTAAILAERLEVSERTIYRDIVDLQSSGVPIEGEPGIGYVMRSGFDLPPLMFTQEELSALVVGARMLRTFGGLDMARAAEEALVKIDAVLPEKERGRINEIKFLAPMTPVTDEVRVILDEIDEAVHSQTVIELKYGDAEGRVSDRAVQPLGLVFWGKVWTLVAWCELRDDFRAFRADRIDAIAYPGRTFKTTREKSFDAYIRRQRDC